MNAQSQKEIVTGILILAVVFAAVAFLGNPQSVAIVGGGSSFELGRSVPTLFSLGSSDWSYIKANGMTCDDMTGKYFVYIQSNSGQYTYALNYNNGVYNGGRLTSSSIKCTYPDGSKDFCSESSSFDFIGACKAGTTLQGRFTALNTQFTGNYVMRVDFYSSTKSKVIFPYNSAQRQSVTFTVTSPAPTPGFTSTPTTTTGPMPTQTIVPTQIPTPTPRVCTPGPICGIDGVTYPDSCVAEDQAHGIQSIGNCPAASSTPIPSGSATPIPQLVECPYVFGQTEYLPISQGCKSSIAKGMDDLTIFGSIFVVIGAFVFFAFMQKRK